MNQQVGSRRASTRQRPAQQGAPHRPRDGFGDVDALATEPDLTPSLRAAVAASTAGHRDEVLVTACPWLLANQLELIRYRFERDNDWAHTMLDAYQEKLIAPVRSKTLRWTFISVTTAA